MKIVEIRRSLGLSQSQFAEKFHIKVDTLRKWEREHGGVMCPESTLFLVGRVVELETFLRKKFDDISVMTIQELRDFTGLTQEQFADMYHMDESELRAWESGEKVCPETVLWMLRYIMRLEIEREMR